MPHRRGSFREDWNELLERFAHRGTPAATDDQIREAKQRKPRRTPDVHQELFKRSQAGHDHERNGADEHAD
jgi:hypothetical protein